MQNLRHWTVFCALVVFNGCGGSGEVGSIQNQERNDWFRDDATSIGIEFKHVSGADGSYLMPEMMGSGIALFDMENDGDLDAYFVQSGSLKNEPSKNMYPNELYRNDGTGMFVKVEAGDATKNLGYGMGVVAADYDGNGFDDLYVTNVGTNVLLRNLGDGTFEDVSSDAGVDDPGWGTSAAFMDFDGDGDLDLFLVNYLRWSVGTELECYHFTLGTRDYCGPVIYDTSAQDRLFRNNGNGTFTDVTFESGLADTVGNGLGLVVVDFNGDGMHDVFVANDNTPSHLWINKGNLSFVEECVRRGCAADEHGALKAGMGIVAEDMDGDLDSDVLIVNLTGQTDTLFKNESGHFIDATTQFGLSGTSTRFTRFGLAMADFDNDGDFDIVNANGAISMKVETEHEDPYAEPDVFYLGSPNGSFNEVHEMPYAYTSRGLATGDIDLDGDIDVVAVNRDARASVYINQQDTSNNWIQFSIRHSNGSSAVGATIEFEVGGIRQMRVVQTAGSYLSSRDPTVHVGLGPYSRVDEIIVRWPNGKVASFGSRQAGSRWELKEEIQY